MLPAYSRAICLGAALSVFISIQVFAQEESGQEQVEIEKISQAEEFLFGEEMVVSATKHEESLLRSPSAVTLITADEIKKYGIRDLVDAFRLVPGLDVLALSPSYTTINIRKSSEMANWPVLFLIDGRKTTIDLMGFSIIETLPVSLEDIERIEVIRGPGSALYGAALSGIINIITKDPVKTEGFLFKAAGGNFNSRELTARASGRSGDSLRYRITASTDATDSREEHIRAKSSSRVTSKLLYDISPSQSLEFQAGFDRTSAGSPFNVGIFGYDMFTPFAFLGWGIKGESQELHAQLHYTRMEVDLSFPFIEELRKIFGPSLGAPFSQLDFLNMSTQGNTYDSEVFYTPFVDLAYNRLTIGANLRYSDAQIPFHVGGHLDETVAALYFQDEFSPIEPITILIGGRYDYNSFSKPSFSPRASIVFVPLKGHSIRASYGESFRKPSFLENQFKVVGLSDLEIFGKSLAISNADLKNQRNDTYELGYQWGHPRFRAFVDAFHTTMHDSFFLNYNKFQFENYTQTFSLYGGEAGSEFIIIPNYIQLMASYSFLQGNDIDLEKGPQFGTRHKLSAAIYLGLIKRFSFGLQAHYIDERASVIRDPTFPNLLLGPRYYDTPSYMLFNASASYTFPKPNFEVGLTVFNVLDTDAYDCVRLHSASMGYYGGERLSRSIMVYLRGEF